jgi:hypothetical protein
LNIERRLCGAALSEVKVCTGSVAARHRLYPVAVKLPAGLAGRTPDTRANLVGWTHGASIRQAFGRRP